MKTRILIAALALVFGFTNLARAGGKEEITHLGHNLKAEFPAVTKQVQKKLDSPNGEVTIDVIVAAAEGRNYMLTVMAIEGQTAKLKDLHETMKGMIDGLEGSFKNVKLVKESELELNKNCPKGRCYLVQHDAGMMVLWATVENGKVYVAWVGGSSKQDLGSKEAKEFLMSIEIEKK
jgi:hypothetical protein